MLPLDLQNETATSFVIFGGSGRLARTKIFPALWTLFRDSRLPQATQIYTFSRTKLHKSELRIRCVPYMGLNKDRDVNKYNSFWKTVHCLEGEYNCLSHYEALAELMASNETKHGMIYANRLFYLALPPLVFDSTTLNISRRCISYSGWNRIIVEKPFGRSDASYRPYQTQLCQTFKESQIYMIDHYLSKQVVHNLLALRFANRIWNETWSNQHIAAVMISVKCEKPVFARAEYFDMYGIIRDVMTNHMMQILAMIAMEQPYSNSAEALRDEKLKVLRSISAVDVSDVVLGQYVNSGLHTDPHKVGYLEHHYIAKGSLTPTFALAVLHVNNKRWSGVPFILRAGKAMNETKTEVRVQYKSMECDFFEGRSKRNELVLRLSPTENVFMRLMLKPPGERLCIRDSELPTMLYDSRVSVPANYVSLLIDVFAGSQLLFMRTDEQCEIWRIFTPLLAKVEDDRIKPLTYAFGSRGPMSAYRKARNYDFVFYQTDAWHETRNACPFT